MVLVTGLHTLDKGTYVTDNCGRCPMFSCPMFPSPDRVIHSQSYWEVYVHAVEGDRHHISRLFGVNHKEHHRWYDFVDDHAPGTRIGSAYTHDSNDNEDD